MAPAVREGPAAASVPLGRRGNPAHALMPPLPFIPNSSAGRRRPPPAGAPTGAGGRPTYRSTAVTQYLRGIGAVVPKRAFGR
jgi:hypothetical protein